MLFTPPASSGGSPITSYDYSTDGGATWRGRQDSGASASPVVVTTLSVDGTTALTNGTPYTVLLRAVNALGTGSASAASNAASPVAPTNGLDLPSTTVAVPVDTTSSVASVVATITTDIGTQPVTSVVIPAVNPGGASTTANLSVAQNVGSSSVTVSQAVILYSSTPTVPITFAPPVSGTVTTAQVTVTVPDATTVLAPAGWDGKVNPPTAGTSSGTAPSGFQVGSTVVEVGSTTSVLLLDKPATVLLKGVTGTVGYRATGSTTWVAVPACNTLAGGVPVFPGDCSTLVNAGADTQVLTYHFTSFAALSVVAPPPAPTPTPTAPSSGGGGGGAFFGPAPVTTPPPAVRENLTSPIGGLQPITAVLSSNSTTVLTTRVVNVTNAGANALQSMVSLSVPPNVAVGAVQIVVQSLNTVDSLVAQAPLPASQGTILSAVSAQVVDQNGQAITTDFSRPVGITFTLPPDAIPPLAVSADFAIAYWSGTAWIDVPTVSELNADGSATVIAGATHFTIYAVRYVIHAFLAPPVFGAGNIASVVFAARGSVDDLAAATRREGASAVWTQDERGTYRLLIVDGPEFLRATFRAAFPNGFTKLTAMTVVRQAPNVASPGEDATGPAIVPAPTVVAPAPVVTAPVAPAAPSAPASAAPRPVSPVVPPAAATPGVPSVPAGVATYVASAADTLSTIGTKFGVDWLAIAAANGIAGPTYVVRPGQPLVIPGVRSYAVSGADTLSDIGARFGVDWLAIANANGINGPAYDVRPGQVLLIPASGLGMQTYTASASDTLSGIGAKFGVDWLTIAAANDIAGPAYLVREGQVLRIPGARAIPRTYTVGPGETLSGIGAKFGMSWPAIASANDITGPNYEVRPGQVLLIPTG